MRGGYPRTFELFVVGLLPGEGHKTVDIDENDDNGNQVAEYPLHPALNLKTLTGIGFGKEFIPAPAELVAAEQGEGQRAQRQQVVAYDEVPEIQPCGALCEGLEGKYAVAQSSGEGNDENTDAAGNAALGTVPAGKLADAGEDVFAHGQYRGHSRTP